MFEKAHLHHQQVNKNRSHTHAYIAINVFFIYIHIYIIYLCIHGVGHVSFCSKDVLIERASILLGPAAAILSRFTHHFWCFFVTHPEFADDRGCPASNL